MSNNQLQVQIDAPQAVEKFKKLFVGIHKVDEERAAQMFEVEKFSFLKETSERGLLDVTPISAMGVFLDVVNSGLSFNSSAKHVYLMMRNVKNAEQQYEKRLVYSTTPDGKIYQCIKSGAIEYVTKPVMVYEGDDFGIATNEQGEQIIRHNIKIPRTTNKIIAGYVYIVHKGGKREPFWMDTTDIDRLKGYSAKNNGRGGQPGNANALYSSNGGQIDTGFFGAKLISHALKNIRKTGTSQYEVSGDEADAVAAGSPVQELPTPEQLPAPEPSAQFEPVMTVEPVVKTEVTYGPAPIEPTNVFDPNAPF